MVIEFKKPGVTSETVTLMRDGTQIVALLGTDLQAGIGGFGDTAAEALRDLAGQMEFENHRLPGSISDPHRRQRRAAHRRTAATRGRIAMEGGDEYNGVDRIICSIASLVDRMPAPNGATRDVRARQYTRAPSSPATMRHYSRTRRNGRALLDFEVVTSAPVGGARLRQNPRRGSEPNSIFRLPSHGRCQGTLPLFSFGGNQRL